MTTVASSTRPTWPTDRDERRVHALAAVEQIRPVLEAGVAESQRQGFLLESTVQALPDGEGGVGTDLGIGASFALGIVDEDVTAQVADGALLVGADDVTVTATGTSALTTEAKTGAKGSTSIAPSPLLS